jgi:cytosine/adenosine deaminase-related metal-dependent hydrolase
MLVRADDGTLRLPALATAHSHAFQRSMRGQAQRPTRPGGDDFWTWRGQMYAATAALTPESIHASSLVAFRELARAGVRTVGEFHYVHHQADDWNRPSRRQRAKSALCWVAQPQRGRPSRQRAPPQVARSRISQWANPDVVVAGAALWAVPARGSELGKRGVHGSRCIEYGRARSR